MRTGTITDKKDRFRALALAHLGRLYSTARRLVGDDAEDAVQETLLRAYLGYDRLRNEEAAGAWLSSILVNCCLDRSRRRARQPEEIDFDSVEEFSLYRKIAREDPFPYSDSLHLDFLKGFGKEDLTQVLLSMPEIYRVPLVLVHMYGYATKEVARILATPLGTVLARLHRGRKLFEKKMWDYAETNGLLKEGVR
jgi:RNA polymerase sigma-70 factor (ECF subfamily)